MEKSLEKNIYIYICITELLFYTPDYNSIINQLYIN